MRRELESLLRSGEFQSVMRLANQHFASDPRLTAESAWVAVMASRAAGATSAWGTAAAWAERGLSFSGGADSTAEGWLHFLRGTALMYIGDFYNSEKALSQFLVEAAGITELLRMKPDANFNQAFLMRLLHRSDDELRLFRASARQYEETGRTCRALQCHLEAGWSLCLAGSTEEAYPELSLVTEGLKQLYDPELETDSQIAWALYYRLCSDLPRSEEICLLLAARQDMLPRQCAEVSWLRGCNALDVGDPALARQLALEAMDCAAKDWWPLQLERIKGLLNLIQQTHGR